MNVFGTSGLIVFRIWCWIGGLLVFWLYVPLFGGPASSLLCVVCIISNDELTPVHSHFEVLPLGNLLFVFERLFLIVLLFFLVILVLVINHELVVDALSFNTIDIILALRYSWELLEEFGHDY